MATSETRDGWTARGFVTMVINYRDDKGNPCEKKDAVQAEVIEQDKDGKVLGRIYTIMDGADGKIGNPYPIEEDDD
jgi:multimeric flavodoxin WrbA